MTNKAMVAVCDILGFSNLVKERPLEEVINYHIKNYHIVLESSIPQVKNQSTAPTPLDILKQGLVGFVSFSDTVLIYSLINERDGYRNVINAVTRLIAGPILWPEYRFRAGIAYGEFYQNSEKNIYVGKAIIEAYELEKKQEWCGGALTELAAEKTRNQFPDNYYLTQYEVPVKSHDSHSTEPHLVINWTLADHDVIDKDYGWLKKNYGVPLTEQQEKIERKLKNTEKFHFDKCNQCKAHRNYLDRNGNKVIDTND